MHTRSKVSASPSRAQGCSYCPNSKTSRSPIAGATWATKRTQPGMSGSQRIRSGGNAERSATTIRRRTRKLGAWR